MGITDIRWVCSLISSMTRSAPLASKYSSTIKACCLTFYAYTLLAQHAMGVGSEINSTTSQNSYKARTHHDFGGCK